MRATTMPSGARRAWATSAAAGTPEWKSQDERVGDTAVGQPLKEPFCGFLARVPAVVIPH